jgi:hypothetical protein
MLKTLILEIHYTSKYNVYISFIHLRALKEYYELKFRIIYELIINVIYDDSMWRYKSQQKKYNTFSFICLSWQLKRKLLFLFFRPHIQYHMHCDDGKNHVVLFC